MKHVFYAVAMLLLLLACETDTYDKGDGKYSMLRADMVELFTNGSGQVVRVVTDENETLSMSPFTVNSMQVPDTLYRAYLYYNIKADGAEPVSLGHVYTLVPHAIDTLKTDPVVFESAWLSTSHCYLNLGLYLKLGATGEEGLRQVIGMHADTLMANADGTKTLYVQFHHDQAGVPEYYSQRTYISIPTDSIDADTVRLRINTYQGVVERVFPAYRPSSL